MACVWMWTEAVTGTGFSASRRLDAPRTFYGLGPLRDVSLAQAREAAAEARAIIREGQDPIELRRQGRESVRVEASRTVTFQAYAEQFISGREAGWKNPRHRQIWRNSLRDYANPHIGHLPVSDVDTAAVLQVLRPIWNAKAETASRVRGRIEIVLSAAKPEGLRAPHRTFCAGPKFGRDGLFTRTGENPATVDDFGGRAQSECPWLLSAYQPCYCFAVPELTRSLDIKLNK
jgi:Arm DNA-binding domain